MLSAFIFDPRNVRDLSSDVIGSDGLLRIMPAAYWQSTTIKERAMLGFNHAIYGMPSSELIVAIQDIIGARSAIEIGAGSGILGAALDIPATDNFLQERPDIAMIYAANRQKTIRYGVNVLNFDAEAALAHFKPDVVVASWVTHKWREDRHGAGGNMFGVDEEAVIAGCQTYIFFGNTTVHRHKSIWSLPHSLIADPAIMFSRAINESSDFLAVWNRP